MIKAKFTVNIYILNIWFEFLYFYRFYSFKIGCSSDQGSPYVRLMKQIQIPGVDFTDSENEEGDRTIQLADTDGATLLDTDGDAIVDTDENDLSLLVIDNDCDDNSEYDSSGHIHEILTVDQEQASYDEGLKTVIGYISSIKFTTPLEGGGSAADVELDLNDETEYDFSQNKGAPIDLLEIELGSCKHGRYCCACHKANIAVRLAIKNNRALNKVISKLTKFAAKHKNTLSSVKLCVAKKVRLRINNETRWASVFLLLDCFHRAHTRNVFNDTFKCPVSLAVIEMYLQILLPAFHFNLIMQKTTSTIANVLPALHMILSKWTRCAVTGSYKLLCNSLIKVFKFIFIIVYFLNNSY